MSKYQCLVSLFPLCSLNMSFSQFEFKLLNNLLHDLIFSNSSVLFRPLCKLIFTLKDYCHKICTQEALIDTYTATTHVYRQPVLPPHVTVPRSPQITSQSIQSTQSRLSIFNMCSNHIQSNQQLNSSLSRLDSPPNHNHILN